jgi:hypothetical protein
VFLKIHSKSQKVFLFAFQALIPVGVRGSDGLGTTSLGDGDVSVGHGFGIEFMITFVLVWVSRARPDTLRNKSSMTRIIIG